MCIVVIIIIIPCVYLFYTFDYYDVRAVYCVLRARRKERVRQSWPRGSDVSPGACAKRRRKILVFREFRAARTHRGPQNRTTYRVFRRGLKPFGETKRNLDRICFASLKRDHMTHECQKKTKGEIAGAKKKNG